MPTPTADRNLLFGILALQMDFIARDQLIAAMNAWVIDKSKSLGQILHERNALTSDTQALLDALVAKHLTLHDHDVEKSLAVASTASLVRQDFTGITDPDLQASLGHLPSSVGEAPATLAEPLQPGDPYATVGPAAEKRSEGGVRYRILRPHAKGGLGEVFVAHDEELHREVALKEIQERHADHPESRARFMLEAEITGGLEHPGIVPVYGLGKYADGRPFYAMRFIRGDSLQDSIRRYHGEDGASASETRVLELRSLLGRFIDVCQAIQYAHDRGVLHRDLKPGNVMLGKYGETLVVDWGLAKAKSTAEPAAPAKQTSHLDEPVLRPVSGSGSAETIAGTALGTPQYMSPEQAEGRLDRLGPASDVYSLGATLYCLLTGKPPVEANHIADILQRVQRGDIPRPHTVKRDVDRALEAVCMKAMALKPEDRYASPRQLAADIEQWLADAPVSVYREPWTKRLARFGARHKTTVTVSGTLLLMLTIFLAISLVDHIDAYRIEQKAIAAWDAHPEFKMNTDFGKMKFNHWLHMTPGIPSGTKDDRGVEFLTLGDIPENMRKRYRNAQENKEDHDLVHLTCGSCHQTDSANFGIDKADLRGLPLNSVFPARSSGQYMLPITYEIQCQACHPLSVNRKDLNDSKQGTLTLPHRVDPSEIHEYLTEVVMTKEIENKLLLKNFKGLAAIAEYMKTLKGSVNQKVDRIEKDLYMSRGACMVCHVAKEDGKQFEVPIPAGKHVHVVLAATHIPQVWFEKANFNHSAHQTTDCKVCHAPAWDSTMIGDILLPQIDVCRQCHNSPDKVANPALRASFGCSECHTEGMLARMKK